MPRRMVLDVAWMRRARAYGWSVNYDRRQFAVAMGEAKCGLVLHVIDRYSFPVPQMELSGWLDKEASGLMMCAKVREACQSAGLPLADYEMLARWYWSFDEWQGYVHAFNALPDPEGRYTFSWEGRVMPKVIPFEAVDKSGVSGGKYQVAPVPRELIERGLRSS